MNTFICASCNLEFKRNRSTEESEKDAIKDGVDLDAIDLVEVCEDCYKEIMLAPPHEDPPKLTIIH